MSEAHVNLKAAQDEMERVQQVYLDTLAQADEHSLHHRIADDKWSLAQVLAHVAEAREFFLGEIERLKSAPGVRMGRTMQDERRLAAVANTETLSAGELRSRLVRSHNEVMRVLKSLAESDLRIMGEHVNPKFGRQSLGELLQHFVIEHSLKHAEQAKRCLANAKSAARS